MSETGGQQRFVLLGEWFLYWIQWLPQSVTQWVSLTKMMLVWFVKKKNIVTILLEFTFMLVKSSKLLTACKKVFMMSIAVKGGRCILHYALFYGIYSKIWYILYIVVDICLGQGSTSRGLCRWRPFVWSRPKEGRGWGCHSPIAPSWLLATLPKP